MAISTQLFDRAVTLFQRDLAKGIDLRKALADFAREKVAEVIAAGQASPRYRRFVNGREGLPEDAVILPGPILYEFQYLDDVIEYAVNFLMARYPVAGPRPGGHYRDSHAIFVNGARWRGDEIPPDAEIVIANTKPYTRKVQVGAKGFRLGRGIYDDAKAAVREKFKGVVDVEMKFVDLEGPGLPYILKHSGFIAKRNGRKYFPKSRAAGQPITYPALIIRQKGL